MSKQSRILISLTSIFIILALVIGGCANKNSAKVKTTIIHPDERGIAGRMFAYFPPGTRIVHSEQRISVNENTIWAVLEIDRNSLDPFIKGMPENRDVSEETRLGVCRSDLLSRNPPDWWNPDKAKKFIAIDTMPEMQLSQGLLIDLDGDKKLTIYVVIIPETS